MGYGENINYKFKRLFFFYELINYFEVYCQFQQVKFNDLFYVNLEPHDAFKIVNLGHEGKTRKVLQKMTKVKTIKDQIHQKLGCYTKHEVNCNTTEK